jgi:hypothetical protein
MWKVPRQQQILRQHYLPQYMTKLTKPNDFWGASIASPPIDYSRIYFQNIYGIQLTINPNRWQSHLQYMETTGISICGLAETNINWSIDSTKNTIQ